MMLYILILYLIHTCVVRSGGKIIHKYMTRYTKKKKPYEIDRTTRIINLRVKKKLNKTRLGMWISHSFVNPNSLSH